MKNFGNVLNGVQSVTQQVKALLKDPNVNYVEQDQVMSGDAHDGNQCGPTESDLGHRPESINATCHLDNNYHTDYDGSGVTAFIIDAGVLNTHNEFGGRANRWLWLYR